MKNILTLLLSVLALLLLALLSSSDANKREPTVVGAKMTGSFSFVGPRAGDPGFYSVAHEDIRWDDVIILSRVYTDPIGGNLNIVYQTNGMFTVWTDQVEEMSLVNYVVFPRTH